jgi:hypothetical protein
VHDAALAERMRNDQTGALNVTGLCKGNAIENRR